MSHAILRRLARKRELDFSDYRHAMSVRTSLRELDRRIHAVFTGERKMPVAPPP